MSQRSQYILGKRIARGGMAEIFLGKAVGSDDFQRLCAIKRILPHYAQENEYVEMFRTEARICKRLQHANIVQVYDFKRVDDSYAIVMEFVDGTDLRALLAACEKSNLRLSVPMAIYIAAQAARGLHYAHTKTDEINGSPLAIVHRDVSPQNILLGFNGEVKIIDFGIAKFEDRHQETKPGVVKGKYSYMSPEQVIAKDVDARTDVFSLAIVLWEILAMRRLFAAETEVETIKNVQGCIIKHNLMELNNAVDTDLNQIILHGLSKEKKKRFISAGAFERELMRYLNRRYPDFTSADLANFVNQLFEKQRTETQKNIQELLTEKTIEELHQTSAISSISDSKMSSEGRAIAFKVDSNTVGIPLASGMSNHSHSKFTNSKLSKASIQSVSLDVLGQSKFQISTQTSNTANQNSNPYHDIADNQYAESVNKNLNFYLSGFTIAIVLLLLIMIGKALTQSKTGNMQILIESQPNNVRVAVDGKIVDKGDYIETPRRFSLPAGRHTMTISRDNYLPRKVEMDGKTGDVLAARNVQLSINPNANIGTISIEAKGYKKLYMILDDGFARGYLPQQINDLELIKKHSIVFYPDFPDRKSAFKCNFDSNASDGKPYRQLLIVKGRCFTK